MPKRRKKERGPKKKGNLSNILLVLIFVAGLSLLLYPSFADYWNSFTQSRAIAGYAHEIAQIDDGTYERLLEEARAYNQRIFQNGQKYNLSEEDIEEYNSILGFTSSGVMGYIQIPSVDVNLPVYHGTSDAVLQIAVGHVEWSSFPVGGANTHSVLSGHRGLPSAKLFTDIDKMVVGDVFILQIMDETLTYEVDQIRIVLPQELNDLRIEQGQDLVTLVTCTPYGINSHRLLVRGHRIANAEEARTVRITADARQIEPVLVAPIIAGIMILLLLIILMVNSIRRRRSGWS